MSSSWLDFEVKARKAIEEELGIQLPSEKVNINGKFKNFDLVNVENKVVGDVKHYKTTSGGNRPSAKFSTLNEYVWLMQLLEKFDKVKWKKLFVVGEDIEMIKKYITEFEKWLGDIEFYYYSEGKACDTNIEKALSFLLRGIDLGNADCEALLGIEYHKGSLVDKNDIKARELLEKSIIAGSIIGKNYMILHFNNLAKKVAGEASKLGESLLKIIEERKPKPFRAEGKIPPNSLCPCGSKLKYKKCCKNGVSKKGSDIHLPWI